MSRTEAVRRPAESWTVEHGSSGDRRAYRFGVGMDKSQTGEMELKRFKEWARFGNGFIRLLSFELARAV